MCVVMFRIVEDDRPPIPEGCSEALQDFLEQCFQKDPEKRPDAEMLCEHEWLKQSWGVNKVRHGSVLHLSLILIDGFVNLGTSSAR